MKPIRGTVQFALAVCVLAMVAAPPGLQAQGLRRGGGGSFVLELNGVRLGVLRSVYGGDPAAEVVLDKGATSHFQTKHIGAVRYEDLVLELGAGMEPGVYDWIAATWAGKGSRMSGAVLACDYGMNVVARQEFSGELVGTTLPALDAAAKEAAFLTVTVRPEITQRKAGAGTVESGLIAKGQRPWLVNAFRLEIAGLDCSRVRKIDPVAVTVKEGLVQFSDLRVTIAESTAETWQGWLQSFVVNGSSAEDQEKSGDLVLLGPDLQSEVARVHLDHVGIMGLERASGGAGDAIRTATARLYCERMTLEWKGGAGATTMNVRAFGR
jgi:hypothetical protein